MSSITEQDAGFKDAWLVAKQKAIDLVDAGNFSSGIALLTEMVTSLIGEVARAAVETAEEEADATALAKAYVAVEGSAGAIKTIEAAVKELGQAKHQMDKALVGLYVDGEIQSVKVDGRNAYLNRSVKASVPAEHKEAAIGVVRGLGLDELITTSVNAQKLGSFVREQERQDADLVAGDDADVTDRYDIDPELAELIRIHQIFNVRVRKA